MEKRDNYPIEQSCFFTGHRNMPSDIITRITPPIIERLTSLISIGVKNFYVGGAIGFDMYAGILMSNMKNHHNIRVTIVTPYSNHNILWNDKDKELYKHLINRVDDIICLSDHYYKGCMFVRNHYMADRSLYCICYLNRKRSGTAETVNYANGIGRYIYNYAQADLISSPF